MTGVGSSSSSIPPKHKSRALAKPPATSTQEKSTKLLKVVPPGTQDLIHASYPNAPELSVVFLAKHGSPEDHKLPVFFDLPEVKDRLNFTAPSSDPSLYLTPVDTGYTYPSIVEPLYDAAYERLYSLTPYTYASGLELWLSKKQL